MMHLQWLSEKPSNSKHKRWPKNKSIWITLSWQWLWVPAWTCNLATDTVLCAYWVQAPLISAKSSNSDNTFFWTPCMQHLSFIPNMVELISKTSTTSPSHEWQQWLEDHQAPHYPTSLKTQTWFLFVLKKTKRLNRTIFPSNKFWIMTSKSTYFNAMLVFLMFFFMFFRFSFTVLCIK